MTSAAVSISARTSGPEARNRGAYRPCTINFGPTRGRPQHNIATRLLFLLPFVSNGHADESYYHKSLNPSVLEMTVGLDEQRLGLVFHGRPDILAGIQKAAG
jgi:hypothetical protein